MPADKRIHRLEDLLVEEVSIVDKPANKRRFLAVKSEDGMKKGAEIKTDDAGNLVTDPAASAPTNPKADPSTASTLTLKVDASGKVLSVQTETPVPTPELAARFAAVGKGLELVEKRLSIDPEMRRGIFRELGDAMGRLQSVLATADVARIDRGEGGSTLVPVLGAELGEIAKVLGTMARKLSTSAAKKNEGDPPPPAADAKVFEELVKTVEAAVEKRGAAMSKGRLGKFKDAIKVLQSILSEIEGVFPPGAKPPPFGGKPAGGKPGGKPGAPPPFPPKGVKKADTPEGVEKAFAGLTAEVEKLSTLVKSQGRVIHDLRKAPGASNVLPIDSSRLRKSEDLDEVSWPLDMNDEKTRETVDKSVSFMD